MLTAESMWQAVLTVDQGFLRSAPTEEIRRAFREMIEHAVPLLGDVPEKKVNLKTFAEARLVFLRATRDTGMIGKIIIAAKQAKLVPEDDFTRQSEAQSMLEMSIATHERMFETLPLEGTVDGTPEVLALWSMLMKIGLDSHSEINAGTLTIGKLMLHHPAAFFSQS